MTMGFYRNVDKTQVKNKTGKTIAEWCILSAVYGWGNLGKTVVFPYYVIESERHIFPLPLTERTCQKHHYNITVSLFYSCHAR